MSERDLFHRVAVHFVMGAALGALFMAALLVLNVQAISDVVLRSTSPVVATIILVSGVCVYFAFGAAITGFHFLLAEEDDRRGRG